MDDLRHISYTPSGRRCDPWAQLRAAEAWQPIRSEVIERFDYEEFRNDFGLGRVQPCRPGAARDVAQAVLDVLNDPTFRRGEERHVTEPTSRFLRQLRSTTAEGRHLELLLPSFAGRPHNPAAHRRVAPDLSEAYALLRLSDISRAVGAVYPPGLSFRLVLDGRAYRKFYGYSDAEGLTYGPRIHDLISSLGAENEITTVDLHDILNTNQIPLAQIDSEVRAAVAHAWEACDFSALVTALRQGTETTAISAALIDLYKSGQSSSLDIRAFFDEAERITTERARHTAFEYAVLMTKLKRLDLLQRSFPDALRATVHPKPGQYSPRLTDPATLVSPWHGVAVLEPHGRIVTRYESLVYQEPDEHTAVFIEGDDAPFFYRRHR